LTPDPAINETRSTDPYGELLKGIHDRLESYQGTMEKQAEKMGELAQAQAVGNMEFKQFRYQHSVVVGQHEKRLGNLDNSKNGAVPAVQAAISALRTQSKIMLAMLTPIAIWVSYQLLLRLFT